MTNIRLIIIIINSNERRRGPPAVSELNLYHILGNP